MCTDKISLLIYKIKPEHIRIALKYSFGRVDMVQLRHSAL